jgi:aerobic carbon-monoxide dehydrogenase medium subunit
MKPLEYLKPKTVEEAMSLMESYGEAAKYIAGGTDLMVKIKEKKIAPDFLISLSHISGMDHIVLDENGRLHIGSLATHRSIEFSHIIKTHFPILHDAVINIGSVQIRNVATIGGNVVNAVPSADGAVPLLALDADARVIGPKGERIIPLKDFFIGPGMTLLERGEIVLEFIIPKLMPRTGSAYWKHTRREAMELPILGVAGVISLDEGKRKCLKARIGLGVAAPTPVRSLGAEACLEGKEITDETIALAAETAASEAKVRDTVRGEAWYRREMVGVLTQRVINMCLERAEKVS